MTIVNGLEIEDMHGVESPYADYAGADVDRVGDAYLEQDTEPEPEDPTPVFIVGQHATKTRKTWHAYRGSVNDQGELIIGHDENRISLKIKNLDPANTLFLSKERIPNYLGYPLAPNAEVSFTHEDKVWGSADIGLVVPYAYIVEMELPVS